MYVGETESDSGGGGGQFVDFREAVAEDLLTLAILHNEELDRVTLAGLREADFPGSLHLRLRSKKGQDAIYVFTQGLDSLLADLTDSTLDRLAADYADIYLNHTLQASPCESVWMDDDNLAMQEAMFRLREQYARRGLGVSDWRKRSEDHLVPQLHFVAHLLTQVDDGLSEAADFLDEHLLRWNPEFARRVASRCGTPLYAGLALLNAAYLDELRDLLAEVLGEPRPTPEEIEARYATKVSTDAPPPRYIPGAAPTW